MNFSQPPQGYRNGLLTGLMKGIWYSALHGKALQINKDFAEKKEIADQSRLWDYQVKELFHRIGA